ncbi:MAG: biotin--[acetyl-CoA-carboxylase] ligase [Lachnospiraceae bacterium]
MTTKERLLELLETNHGQYFSGEEIARILCISRAAVWKAVKSLRNEGYEIDAVTNKGYCLYGNTDVLSAQGIYKYLNSDYNSTDLHVLQTTDSTNSLVREAANQGAPQGYTVIAGEQKKGRGRYGRNFFSPDGTGVYMSVLLRPYRCSGIQATRITTMAAVAMCEAIEETTGESARIKWVNDIFVKGKKVCGILTEASFGLESGMLEYAVLGVGVNLYEPCGGFPEELKPIAGSVCDVPQANLKNRMVASFLNHFMWYYQSQDKTEYIDKYKAYSLAMGKMIKVISENGTKNALVYGIDDDCRLMVEYDNGEHDCLSYGEISISMQDISG